MTQPNFAFGDNCKNILGCKPSGDQNKPVKIDLKEPLLDLKDIGCFHQGSIFLNKEGKMYQFGTNENNKEVKVENVKKIWCGTWHYAFVTYENDVYMLGRNTAGQLGNGNQTNVDTPFKVNFFNEKGLTLKQIVLGYQQSYFLCENGELYGCGSNQYGDLGLGPKGNQSTITKLESDVLGVYSGKISYFFHFLKEDGLYASGNNGSGNLGNGSNQNVKVPVKVKLPEGFEHQYQTSGYFHSLILGEQNNSQVLLTTGSSTINGLNKELNVFTPIPFFQDKLIKSFDCGCEHTILLTEDSRIYCWGYGAHGRCGNGSTTNQVQPYEVVIKEISEDQNLKVHAGCYSSFVFHCDEEESTNEFLELFKSEKCADFEISKFKVHKELLVVRTGSSIENVKDILSYHTDEELEVFFYWLYGDKITKPMILKKICLKFGIENPISHKLKSDLAKLFKDDDSKDFTIKVTIDDEEEYDDNEEEEEFEEIFVHKFVLYAKSGLFREMFNNINENKNINSIKDFSGKTVESIEIFIKFLYTNQIELTADDDPQLIVEELQDATEYYQLGSKALNLHLTRLKKQFNII
ncbi:btk-binding protein-related [Anaeramoeba flamelloides]|uniref:Btk-binding protein-related n=1 Tax=Anaeramoeba flamelloides TaxID=1746091 RepID=A0AAV7YPB8_9EUKA|nr:btk-binding protein-related [Anaeramoeba flamelloides]